MPDPKSAGDGVIRTMPSSLSWQEVGQGAQIVVEGAGPVLTATLGSCVAVMLHDAAAGRGGMNHIFRAVESGAIGGAAVAAEVEALVNALMRIGSLRTDLVARLAGGARTLGRGPDLGGQIASVCLRCLKDDSIPVVQSDIGGTRARRLAFDPFGGEMVVTYPGTRLDRKDAPRRAGGAPELF